ncbi:DUF4493 domain-containing protein, partial [Bacteroidota bacterium]
IGISNTYFSCQEKDPIVTKGKGKIILNLGLDIDISITQGRIQQVNTNDFKVTVYDALKREIISFDRYADITGEIELDTGTYYVSANSDNLLPAAFENPYFYGESEVFHLSHKEVKIVDVTCELSNVLVSVKYSDNIYDNFDDFNTQVSAGIDTLTYYSQESRIGYFELSPLEIISTLYYTKTDSTHDVVHVIGSIENPTLKTHYIITIDATIGGFINPVNIIVDESSDSVHLLFTNDTYIEPYECTNEYGSFLIGDKDGFGIGLEDGQIYNGDWFDNRENDDPVFTDMLPPPNHADFTYSHSFDPVCNINSAELNIFTLGIQDGDNQVYQSDTDIKLFINDIEIPQAFDDVDQFDLVNSEWVSFAGQVTIPIPDNMLVELTSGKIDVRIVTLALGEYQGLDVFALDFSELVIR